MEFYLSSPVTFPEADTMAAVMVMWQAACSSFLAFTHSHFTGCSGNLGNRQHRSASGGGGRGSDGCGHWVRRKWGDGVAKTQKLFGKNPLKPEVGKILPEFGGIQRGGVRKCKKFFEKNVEKLA